LRAGKTRFIAGRKRPKIFSKFNGGEGVNRLGRNVFYDAEEQIYKRLQESRTNAPSFFDPSGSNMIARE
jgi:hypothetical protein